MNEQHGKGVWNEAKGHAKQQWGKATGNEALHQEGVIDRVKGKLQQVAGDFKDAVKGGLDRVLHHSKNA